jgi:hypothetical protein
MKLVGTGVGIANFRLRFFILVFMGIMALGSVLYWRKIEISTAEYVYIPTQYDNSADNPDTLKSKNFQIEVKDTSPSAQ